MKTQSADLFRALQSDICTALEAVDGTAEFKIDDWKRQDAAGGYGGGGRTRILRDGGVFERAGVNFSEVHGTLPLEMSHKLVGSSQAEPFYATGVSLVLHPYSPMIPTTHANFRYLEVADKKWFGGGSDLTPYYLFEDDAVHFHTVIKDVCDKYDETYYPRFKKECDEYFYLPHRQEARGVGGLFFDYLGRDDASILDETYSFLKDIGEAFVPSYLPIVERRKEEPWTEAEKRFQLIRRGRYVEFNLLYDRGTRFGLSTNGRIESILMSLPPNVSWEYDMQVAAGSREAELLEVVRSPRAWV